jgi:hypothetical protein
MALYLIGPLPGNISISKKRQFYYSKADYGLINLVKPQDK